MKMREWPVCSRCGRVWSFRVVEKVSELEVQELVFSYNELVSYCEKCGNEITVPIISEENIRRKIKAHKRALAEAGVKKMTGERLVETVRRVTV